MVTSEGYVRRTYEEILNAKIAKAEELFGADINTDSNTALGKYIRINAYDQYKVEEMAEKIYYSIFPQTASGQTLDRLAWTVGISRKAATHSICEVKISGETGAVVETKFSVGTEAGLNFHNTVDTTIGEDGTCVLTVECDEAGSVGNINSGDIVKIINPVSYVHEIVASDLKITGEDEESDYDFLERYEIAREGNGSCNATSIKTALINIPSVKDAYIKTTESEAEGDMPANTIACYVHGGETAHQEIAEAIFDKKPIGIGTYGKVSVPVSYGALTDYMVNFSHVEEVGVYIKIGDMETDDTFDSTNGNADILNNIQKTIRDLGVGKTLVLTRLYPAIYGVAGVITANIAAYSSSEDTYSRQDIEIEPYQICTLKSLIINEETVYMDEV